MNTQGFKSYLLRQGKARATIENYLSSIRLLLKTSPELIKVDLEEYLTSQLEGGKSPSQLNNLVMALRHYGDYIGINYRDIKYFTVKETYKSTLSDQEIEAFLALPLPTKKISKWYQKNKDKGYLKERYKLMTLFFSILAYSGMRPNEVAQLTIDSIDFGRGFFILERTKTTPRHVPIAPGLLDDLTAHIKELKGKYLFYGRFGEPVQRHAWQDHFKERITRLGIKRNKLTTYSLRHSFITRMLGEDVNLMKVQKIVGHKKIETTANYTHLTTKDMTTAIRKDPLSRTNLPLYERVKMFRELAFKLLEDFANNPDEERELIESLKIYS